MEISTECTDLWQLWIQAKSDKDDLQSQNDLLIQQVEQTRKDHALLEDSRDVWKKKCYDQNKLKENTERDNKQLRDKIQNLKDSNFAQGYEIKKLNTEVAEARANYEKVILENENKLQEVHQVQSKEISDLKNQHEVDIGELKDTIQQKNSQITGVCEELRTISQGQLQIAEAKSESSQQITAESNTEIKKTPAHKDCRTAQIYGKSLVSCSKLNIMVLGQEGIGKSTFIRMMQQGISQNYVQQAYDKPQVGLEEYYENFSKILGSYADEFQEAYTQLWNDYKVEVGIPKSNWTVTFQESPFKLLSRKEHLLELENFIENQNKQFRKQVEGTSQGDMPVDDRIDLILYFLSPFGDIEEDLKIIKKLSENYFVAPVLARCDSGLLAKDWIRQRVSYIYSWCQQKHISIFEIPDALYSKYNPIVTEKPQILSVAGAPYQYHKNGFFQPIRALQLTEDTQHQINLMEPSISDNQLLLDVILNDKHYLKSLNNARLLRIHLDKLQISQQNNDKQQSMINRMQDVNQSLEEEIKVLEQKTNKLNDKILKEGQKNIQALQKQLREYEDLKTKKTNQILKIQKKVKDLEEQMQIKNQEKKDLKEINNFKIKYLRQELQQDNQNNIKEQIKRLQDGYRMQNEDQKLQFSSQIDELQQQLREKREYIEKQVQQLETENQKLSQQFQLEKGKFVKDIGQLKKSKDQLSKTVKQMEKDMQKKDRDLGELKENEQSMKENIETNDKALQALSEKDIEVWDVSGKGCLRWLLLNLDSIIQKFVPGVTWNKPDEAELRNKAGLKKYFKEAQLLVHPDKIQQRQCYKWQIYAANQVYKVLQSASDKEKL